MSRDEREKLATYLNGKAIQPDGRVLLDISFDELKILRFAFGSIVLVDGEAHAEIQRLQDAKRRALAIADERAKENVALRAALAEGRSIPAQCTLRDALQKIADTDQYPDSEDTAPELREIARNALETGK